MAPEPQAIGLVSLPLSMRTRFLLLDAFLGPSSQRKATMARHLKVLIIGAGTGGLCLAQGLKKDGIATDVFERDHTPTNRLQGYRLSLSATGNRALKACLPDTIFDSLVKCSAQPSQRVSFQDHRLNHLLAVDLPRNGQDPLETEHP